MKLSIEHLSFSYGDHAVLQDVSFSLNKGDFLSVLGPNGTGKSTLFRCILGMLPISQGQIRLNGEDICSFSQRELAKRIAYVPQLHRPVYGYTVLDTVLMGTARQLGPFEQPGEKQKKCAMDALERLNAAHMADKSFSLLSGGEQQLVLLARAIAQQAEILLMDEPTSALDFGNQQRILKQIQMLTLEGYAVMMSTHHPQHAMQFSNRLLALSQGRAAAFDDTHKALTPKLLHTLYGVDASIIEMEGRRWIAS